MVNLKKAEIRMGYLVFLGILTLMYLLGLIEYSYIEEFIQMSTRRTKKIIKDHCSCRNCDISKLEIFICVIDADNEITCSKYWISFKWRSNFAAQFAQSKPFIV